jgi:hypothetical protein
MRHSLRSTTFCLLLALERWAPQVLQGALKLYVIPALSVGPGNSVIAASMMHGVCSDCFFFGNKIYIPVREQASPVRHGLVRPARH